MHFRAVGQALGVLGVEDARVRAFHPAGGGRALYGHLVPWRVPALVTPRGGGEPFQEHFRDGSVRMMGPVGLWLGHRADGGTRIGHLTALRNNPAWCDMIALVDDSAAGNAALDGMGDDGDRLPLSIGFEPLPNGTVRDNRTSPPTVERTLVRLVEVAIVDTATWEEARLYARGHLPGLA
jgi:hypothetical protein